MPYRELIFYKGGYYHIYSRGIEKRTIFLDRADNQRFLSRLKDYKKRHQITVLAYCLMPNHYHLLIRQDSDEPLSAFLQRLNVAYSMYFNKRYERVGPLFQGRFKTKLIDSDEYLLHLSRYIHLNPKEILSSQKSLRNYPWFSYRAYLNSPTNDPIVDSKLILGYFSKINPALDYNEFVEGEDRDFEEISNLTIE